MATGGNGKDSFDALIARGLGMSITDSAGECPDDDVLTAFASRKLSAPEHGHWESHVAGCANCAQLVAQVGVERLEDGLGSGSFRKMQVAEMQNPERFACVGRSGL